MLSATATYRGFWATARGNQAQARREVRAAIGASCAAAIRFWHERFSPGHFELSAKGKYGYAPRTKSYMLTKAHKFHHQLPLVFTGTMKAMILSAIRVQEMGSGMAGAKGTMTGPRYTRWRPHGERSPDMAKELTTIAPAEEAVLTQSIEAGTNRRLAQMRGYFARRIA